MKKTKNDITINIYIKKRTFGIIVDIFTIPIIIVPIILNTIIYR